MIIPTHKDSAAGPISNLAAIYCGQVDAAMKAGEPGLRTFGCYQLEWAHLVAQRTRAWTSLPMELSHCKTPADLVALQLRFWQTMALNYTESLHRIWAVGGHVGTVPVAEAMFASQRDFMEVREPSADTAKPKRQAA